MAFDIVSCGKRSRPFMNICRQSRQQLPDKTPVVVAKSQRHVGMKVPDGNLRDRRQPVTCR